MTGHLEALAGPGGHPPGAWYGAGASPCGRPCWPHICGRGMCCLVSSGPTVHAAAQAELPELPGVVIVPTVGGRDEPEAW